MTATTADVVVVGGGVVGQALALGLARARAAVLVLDGQDGGLNAARANFGLVWVQSKGLGMPAYQAWTRRSADLWPDFAARLTAETGVDTAHRRPGGLSFLMDPEAVERAREKIHRMHNQAPEGGYRGRVIGRDEVQALMGATRLGPSVAGAIHCPDDGDVDPLATLAALQAAGDRLGVKRLAGWEATTIRRANDAFEIATSQGAVSTARVVLAAGHGIAALAPQLGLHCPIRPERGQILVTERLAPLVPLPCSGLRQTADGTVMIGATHEDVGFDTSATAESAIDLAARAVATVPALAGAKVVRQWGGLRVLTPDGAPLYQMSASHPGASVVTCHSGVTLAAVHAEVLAPALMGDRLPEEFAPFSAARFAGAGDTHVASHH